MCIWAADTAWVAFERLHFGLLIRIWMLQTQTMSIYTFLARACVTPHTISVMFSTKPCADPSKRPTPIHATTPDLDQASHTTPHLTRLSPSSSILRTWSYVPPSRFPFLYPSLTPSLASHARAFYGNPKGPLKSGVNRIKNADKRSRTRDEEARRKEKIMLQVLRATEDLDKNTELGETPDKMDPKKYAKLRREAKKGDKGAAYAQQKLIRMAKRAELGKALKGKGLSVEDLDVKEDEEETEIDDVGKLMGEMRSPAPVAKERVVRLPSLTDLQKKIRQLEARIEFETMASPAEDPGQWQDYHALPQGKDLGRETKRALWRQRRKAAARIAKIKSEGGMGLKERETFEQIHKQEVDEMRRVLGQFKVFLEKYQKGGLPDSSKRDWNASLQRDVTKWSKKTNTEKKKIILKEREEKISRLGKLVHPDKTRGKSNDGFSAVERGRGKDAGVMIEGEEDFRRPRRIDRETLKSFKVPELSFRPEIETKIKAMEADAELEPKSDTQVKKVEETKPDSRLGQLRDVVSSISLLKKLTAKTTSGEAGSPVKAEGLKGPIRYSNANNALVLPPHQNRNLRTTESSQPVSQQGHVPYDDSLVAPYTSTPWPTKLESSPKEPTIFGTSHPPEPIPPSWPEPQKQRSLSENLKPPFPAEGKVVIDDELTVNFDAHVSDMQSQLFQLQSRLKNAYPRIDTLPYEVWTSKNPLVLKIWLKILTGKWVSRFDDVNVARSRFSGEWEEGVLGADVKEVLDTMVRDHDLTNEAAERMGKRWMQVFDRRGGIEGDGEGKLDLEEFDAQMGWLRDQKNNYNTRKEGGGLGGGFLGGVREKEEKEEEGRDRGKEVGSMFEDLPYTWSSKPSDGFRRAGTRGTRSFSTSARRPTSKSKNENSQMAESTTKLTSSSPTTQALPHLTSTGSAHMVSVSSKSHTVRTAIAVGTVTFSNPVPLTLIRSNSLKKGDVLSVSRIAGIMAAKRTPDLIPLCHPITLTHAGVELFLFSPPEGEFKEEKGKGTGESNGYGGVNIEAKVECTGATGVEMEALTAVSAAALTVVDMCKAVDKGMRIQSIRVVLKEGGRSGVWREEGWVSAQK
jgi:molybdenum cofactor biosynthesis protein MoaC